MMLHGRVAIVTAVSKHLASLGARVAVAYIGDPSPLWSSQPQPRAIAVQANVSDASQVKALFDAAAAAFGGELHILVTLAAVLGFSYPPLAETSEATLRRHAANRLVRDGRGRIVTFSSSGFGVAAPGYTAYAASKAAVELRGTGIRPTRWRRAPRPSPMLAGRLGMPEDIAPLVGFLVVSFAATVAPSLQHELATNLNRSTALRRAQRP
ncbi:hypothetical protein HU200_064407 [Digitaria exilis]|uniref:Uncharacterized protein n=1 Tax=Digitaria exilis TaxID=1010633 RepID=A0A835A1X8_9POAL|nr:hypothetical protein HU200_064407 [Digitaria exilis]